MGNNSFNRENLLAQNLMKRSKNSISQMKLASMSGVSYGSIKRFETTGQISLISLTEIAMALDIADELRNIFTQNAISEHSGGYQ